MSQLVFVDIETTGLDPTVHQVVEIAYAVGDSDIVTLRIPHTLKRHSAGALEVSRYFERELGDPLSWTRSAETQLFLGSLVGATLVGANPAFDARFLGDKYGVVWHHRLLDIEAYAAGHLLEPAPLGLAALVERFQEDGYPITTPDHTAANDVAAVRDIYRAIRGALAPLVVEPAKAGGARAK